MMKKKGVFEKRGMNGEYQRIAEQEEHLQDPKQNFGRRDEKEKEDQILGCFERREMMMVKMKKKKRKMMKEEEKDDWERRYRRGNDWTFV